jgi:hypothetical protein
MIALILAEKAARLRDPEQPSALDIRNRRHALVWNSIALTINNAVVVIYFLFIPITLFSDGKMSWAYFLRLKTLAFLLSYISINTHFYLVNFILLETDYKWIIASLGLWAFANLTVEADGLFFSEMTGAKNIVKVSLSAFFILASICFYFVLCRYS